jgi:hypothetical protein
MQLSYDWPQMSLKKRQLVQEMCRNLRHLKFNVTKLFVRSQILVLRKQRFHCTMHKSRINWENLKAVTKWTVLPIGEPLWLSGKVVKNEKINEINRTWVHSPPPGNLFKKIWLFRPGDVVCWHRLRLPPRRLVLWVVRSNPARVYICRVVAF